jgi:hypothetical protein
VAEYVPHAQPTSWHPTLSSRDLTLPQISATPMSPQTSEISLCRTQPLLDAPEAYVQTRVNLPWSVIWGCALVGYCALRTGRLGPCSAGLEAHQTAAGARTPSVTSYDHPSTIPQLPPRQILDVTQTHFPNAIHYCLASPFQTAQSTDSSPLSSETGLRQTPLS